MRMVQSSDVIFICCPACKGEGEQPVFTHINHRGNCWDGYMEPCTLCDGRREIPVPAEPILITDLPPPRDQ